MNANDKIVEPRTGPSSLVRPRYSPGLMLEDSDLTQAVDYSRDLSRLLFRSLFGCGVICGLKVSVALDCGKLKIGIAPGVALDCAGDPVQVVTAQTFSIDPTCGKPPPDEICVVLRHHERSCQPRSSACASDDSATAVSTRITEGFELRLLAGACDDCCCGCRSRLRLPAEVAAAPKEISAAAATKGAAKSEVKPAAETDRNPQMAATSRGCCCSRPSDPCYADHYKAECNCCDDCEWVVLARVLKTRLPNAKDPTWVVDHSVRRLVRPVLICDQQAAADVHYIETGEAPAAVNTPA